MGKNEISTKEKISAYWIGLRTVDKRETIEKKWNFISLQNLKLSKVFLKFIKIPGRWANREEGPSSRIDICAKKEVINEEAHLARTEKDV